MAVSKLWPDLISKLLHSLLCSLISSKLFGLKIGSNFFRRGNIDIKEVL